MCPPPPAQHAAVLAACSPCTLACTPPLSQQSLPSSTCRPLHAQTNAPPALAHSPHPPPPPRSPHVRCPPPPLAHSPAPLLPFTRAPRPGSGVRRGRPSPCTLTRSPARARSPARPGGRKGRPRLRTAPRRPPRPAPAVKRRSEPVHQRQQVLALPGARRARIRHLQLPQDAGELRPPPRLLRGETPRLSAPARLRGPSLGSAGRTGICPTAC